MAIPAGAVVRITWPHDNGEESAVYMESDGPQHDIVQRGCPGGYIRVRREWLTVKARKKDALQTPSEGASNSHEN